MKYKLLLFDADGTLYDFEKSEKYALRKTFEDFGLKYSEGKILPLFKDVNLKIWKEFERNEITAEKLKIQRFSRFLNRLNIDNISPEVIGKKYTENLADENSLLPGAEALINELAGKFNLVLITNGLSFVQRKRLYNSPLTKYWKEIVISEEVGFTKPNKEIFEYTFKKIGCTNKSEALIIGDNLSSDILGGINYGIDTCWFNPKKNPNNSEIHPTYEIAKLYQLKEIVLKD